MTAVEFLIKNITLYVSNENEYTFNKLFEIALEMEKQQIKDAYIEGKFNSDIKDIAQSSEQYYSETYKTNNP